MITKDIAMKLISVGITAGRGCSARVIAEQTKRLRDEGLIDSDTALDIVIELTWKDRYYDEHPEELDDEEYED